MRLFHISPVDRCPPPPGRSVSICPKKPKWIGDIPEPLPRATESPTDIEWLDCKALTCCSSSNAGIHWKGKSALDDRQTNCRRYFEEIHTSTVAVVRMALFKVETFLRGGCRDAGMPGKKSYSASSWHFFLISIFWERERGGVAWFSSSSSSSDLSYCRTISPFTKVKGMSTTTHSSEKIYIFVRRTTRFAYWHLELLKKERALVMLFIVMYVSMGERTRNLAGKNSNKSEAFLKFQLLIFVHFTLLTLRSASFPKTMQNWRSHVQPPQVELRLITN